MKDLKRRCNNTTDFFDLTNQDIQIKSGDDYVRVKSFFRNVNQSDNLEIKLVDGRVLNVSKDHPFVTRTKREIQSKDLNVGDKLLKVDGSEIEIKSIEEDSRFQNMYDFETYNSTFNFNDILSHNCRTRVMSNVNGREGAIGRGNLSFNSINLPMLALNAGGDLDKFYKLLQQACEIADQALLERLEVQGKQQKRNLPFMVGCNMWLDSETLVNDTDPVALIIKHGTLSIGFVGLAECLVCLTGKHHGESEEADKLGYEIVKYIKDYCDKRTEETHLNYSCLGTPAETYCYTALKQARNKHGIVPGVTDKEYFTNSSHVPVGYPITIKEKATIEGKYHKLENAGHIFYCEVDGDISNNIDAFEEILHEMSDADIGYGAVNIPLIWCPNCNGNFRGSADVHVCPLCGYNELDDDK